MNTVVSLLLLIVCSSFRDSSDFSIALTLLKNLNRLDEITKNTFLEEAGISNHSLMRFCDMLGHKNFSSLKLALVQTCNIRKHQMREHHDNNDNQSLLKQLSSLCNSQYDEKTFVNTVKNINEIIYESNKVLIVGAVYPEILCMHYMEDMLMMDKLIYSVPLKMNIQEKDTVVILISLTGRVYIEHYDEIKQLIDSGVSIIGIGNQNTVPQGIQLKEFLSLPFVGDVESENGAIPLIMQYLKYDYLRRFAKGGTKMPVYENLWSIVENTPLYSADSRIAQYILLNYEDIDQHHLDDIAYGSGVVKSTVSKFFKELSEEGTYASFLAAVHMDKKYDKVQRKKEINSLESNKYVNDDNLKFLVNSIQSASHVIVFTKSQYLNEVRDFCHHLLKYSIIAKSSLYCYKSTLKQELLSQKENDCILFIETDGSFYEYALKLESEMDFSNFVKLPKCKKYVISNQTQKFRNIESIEFVQSKRNDNQKFLNSVFSSIYHEMDKNISFVSK